MRYTSHLELIRPFRCRYSVAVDSSVLGPNSDGYVHRYTELRDQRHEPALLHLDTGECEAWRMSEACKQIV